MAPFTRFFLFSAIVICAEHLHWKTESSFLKITVIVIILLIVLICRKILFLKIPVWGTWAYQHYRFGPSLTTDGIAFCWDNFRLRLPLKTASRQSPADRRAHPGHHEAQTPVVWPEQKLKIKRSERRTCARERISKFHQNILELISYVGSVLSILGLFITILIYSLFR